MPDSRDHQLLADAVREAGALALTMFRQHVRRWIKPDGSPVTEADLAVDKLLRARLQSARPAYGWLSEETPDTPERLHAPALWIADPIDGTRAFMQGSDEWCVAAALVVSGRPVFAAVYRPVAEQFFEAIMGKGAHLNGQPLQLRRRSRLEGAKVIGSSGALKKLAASSPITPYPKTSVPLALRLCLVATGEYDAALSTGNKSDWDLAAGDLIVHEAGGKVTGLDGRLYAFNGQNTWQHGMVAGSASLHKKIISVMGMSDGKEGG